MDGMTNEQITAEFEELFGGGQAPDEEEGTPEDNSTEPEEGNPEDTADESAESETSEGDEGADGEESGEESSDNGEPSEDTKKQSKQNYAFAEQRLQIKKNEQFIRSLGKLIGFDEKASVDEIQEKIKDALIEKEAKENNISVDLARRLDRAEELIQENDRIKLEKKVHEDFSELIDKHNLDKEQVEEFTSYLMDEGKNPLLDPTVDIESEYLKLHFQDMIDAAVADALAKEEARKKKVEEKAASGAPKGASEKEEGKVSSVKDLDDLFNSTDL